jgi:hypothetical protein
MQRARFVIESKTKGAEAYTEAAQIAECMNAYHKNRGEL